MPKCLNRLSHCWLWLAWLPLTAVADAYGVQISHASLRQHDNGYYLHANLDYSLSPTAKNALLKGIALQWQLQVSLSENRLLGHHRLFQTELPFQLQFHALLNQYQVRHPTEPTTMYLSLAAALQAMANVEVLLPLETAAIQAGKPYQLAVKARFNREQLPTPLRPLAYFDPEWFLSSNWYLCPVTL